MFDSKSAVKFSCTSKLNYTIENLNEVVFQNLVPKAGIQDGNLKKL